MLSVLGSLYFVSRAISEGVWRLRRCVNKPAVCQNAAKQLQKSPELTLSATNQVPVEVYSSQASCCKAGLGAFDSGCSLDA